jgi:hypothetical protein
MEKACQLMNQFAKPGDLVTVWGFAPELYVETGTLPATRDSHMPYQMMFAGPLLAYYRDRFMEDLQLRPPKVFVDAVGPGQSEYRDREAHGYETFPALREYVDRNFYLAGDVDGVRVFARKRDTAGVNAASRGRVPTIGDK